MHTGNSYNMKVNITRPLVIFDLETTGLNVCKDRIVEISSIKVMPDGETVERTRKINPTIPIPEETSKIHGIYDKDVQNEPTFKEISKSLFKYLDGCDLGGYNCINFDIPLLMEEFYRVGIDLEISDRKIIDSSAIFHLMEKRNLSSALKFYCGETHENAHNALADAQATYKVLLGQLNKYDNKEVTDRAGNVLSSFKNDVEVINKICMSNRVDLSGKMIYDKKGVEVFNFGKHKYLPVRDIIKNDNSYYEWIMNGDFPLDTKRKIRRIKESG